MLFQSSELSGLYTAAILYFKSAASWSDLS